MVFTRSRSREMERQKQAEEQQIVEQRKRNEANQPPEQWHKRTPMETNKDPHLHYEVKRIGGTELQAPVSYDEVLPEDIKRIAKITWFSSHAILVDSLNEFMAFERYIWDAELFEASLWMPCSPVFGRTSLP